MSNLGISRRAAIAGGIAAVGASSLANSVADETPWIDAHSHIWPPGVSKFRLAPGMSPDDLSPRSFTDAELMAIARPEGVGKVVLIQHTLFHGYDNSYLIDAYQRHPDTFRVVGMVDDLRPKCGIVMRDLLKSGVTGFRIKPRKGINEWLKTDGMLDMWKTAEETRQSMCCLINPHNIPEVHKACESHPNTPVVIDHFARIGITGQVAEQDLANLCGLAKFKHVKIKLSAYYALGKKQPPHTELISMIKRLYETFGPQRLMWASDCPYQLGGENSYRDSISLIRDQLDFVSDQERKQLLQTTAKDTFFFV